MKANLTDSLNGAIAYSWVLGWYAGLKGNKTDEGKIQASADIKASHPDIVNACNAFPELLAACKAIYKAIGNGDPVDIANVCAGLVIPAIAKAEQA
jgi:hypothetical protein